MILPFPTHLQYPVGLPRLQTRMRDLLDSEAGGDSRRAVLHLVEGTPDDGPADTTLDLDRVHGRRGFGENRRRN